MARPSAFAVLRLMTNSNVVGCTTGSFGGLGAFEDLSNVSPDLTIDSREARSIADQAPGRDELTELIDRWNAMACRQGNELLAPAREEWIGEDEERVGWLLDEGGEGGVDLSFGAGPQDSELHPGRPRRFLHGSYQAPRSRNGPVHEQGDHPGLGNQLGQKLEPFGIHHGSEEADACEVAARPGETGDQTLPDRVVAGDEDDWDRRRCVFRRVRRWVAACYDHIHFAAAKVGGQGG
jgi:hypothetical protein